MTYRISYDDGVPISVKKWRNEEDIARTETYETEREALKRARELLDDGDHGAVVLCDGRGNTLGGIRLQLKLGIFSE
jgi:hypothetical protein